MSSSPLWPETPDEDFWIDRLQREKLSDWTSEGSANSRWSEWTWGTCWFLLDSSHQRTGPPEKFDVGRVAPVSQLFLFIMQFFSSFSHFTWFHLNKLCCKFTSKVSRRTFQNHTNLMLVKLIVFQIWWSLCCESFCLKKCSDKLNCSFLKVSCDISCFDWLFLLFTWKWIFECAIYFVWNKIGLPGSLCITLYLQYLACFSTPPPHLTVLNPPK